MVAPVGEASANNARRIAVQMPPADAPPTPYAHTATAVAYAQSPITNHRPGKGELDPSQIRMRKTHLSESPVSRMTDWAPSSAVGT